MSDTNKQLAKDYFERHTSDECFITSDGRVFHNSGAATGYASLLKDNEVEKFHRTDFAKAKAKAKDETGDSDDESSAESAAAKRAEAIEALKAFDAEKPNAHLTGKAILQKLGITLESWTKDAVVAAIEAEKAKLNADQ